MGEQKKESHITICATDFYLGMGSTAIWLGRVGCCFGGPHRMPDSIKNATTQEEFRNAVFDYIDTATHDYYWPENGWNFTQKDSSETPFTYAFNRVSHTVHACNYGKQWELVGKEGGFSRAWHWKDGEKKVCALPDMHWYEEQRKLEEEKLKEAFEKKQKEKEEQKIKDHYNEKYNQAQYSKVELSYDHPYGTLYIDHNGSLKYYTTPPPESFSSHERYKEAVEKALKEERLRNLQT